MNQLQLYIENLGAIKQAELTINPLTILAGENGTGKSFVTKFLYSVLTVLQRDLYKERVNNLIDTLYFTLGNIVNNDEKIKNIILKFEYIKKRVSDGYYDYQVVREVISLYEEMKDDIQKAIDMQRQEYMNSKLDYNRFIIEQSLFFDTFNKLQQLSNAFENPEAFYKRDLFIPKLLEEIHLNFQISNIDFLINNGEDFFVFNIKGIIKITYHKGENGILEIEWFDLNLAKSNNVIFLESPVYWRELSLFRQVDSQLKIYKAENMNRKLLTGVPKHFFDLRDLIFLDFVNNEQQDFIKECMGILKKSLKGNFNIGHEDLYFEDEFGYSINKNLVSFGMTNLGIIQLLLSKNIINRGSFIFIDEPESNLHPAWQAVLANILVKLAKHGVYIIMTTHSSDVLKALDVISQEHQQSEDFISVHYFEKTGYLLALNQSEHSHIQQARLKLLETYDDLVLRGYLV